MDNNIDKLIDSKNKGIEYIKNRAFDFIAVGIIIAVTALSLGVMELREVTVNTIVDILLECLPFYVAAVMLSNNFYNKGSFLGKQTDEFKKAIDYYSSVVNKLTGQEMGYLSQFCLEYNNNTLKQIQKVMLRSVALTYEMYDKGVADKGPLKVMSKRQLKQLYNKDVVKVIIRCKRVKIKGIHPNILLSTSNSYDNTDLGYGEKDLRRKRKLSYAGAYIVTIFLMSLIAVKNVLQWGWMGAALTLFKILYISLGAYTKHFNGYEDITVNVKNHLYRKTDILKEFYYWYEAKSNSTSKDLG